MKPITQGTITVSEHASRMLYAMLLLSFEDDYRPQINGVVAEFDDSNTVLIATDGRILGVLDLPPGAITVQPPADGVVVFNHKTVQLAKKRPFVMHIDSGKQHVTVKRKDGMPEVFTFFYCSDFQPVVWRKLAPTETKEVQPLRLSSIYVRKAGELLHRLGNKDGGIEFRSATFGLSKPTLMEGATFRFPQICEFFGLIAGMRMDCSDERSQPRRHFQERTNEVTLPERWIYRTQGD